ncbi:MAG TPA: aldehyde ferredoxin oxidoreductase family protein [Bacillota bacterium]
MNGYGGKILRIDLSSGRITGQPTPKEMAEKFLGGRGFAAKILFDELDPGVEPLSPDNLVVVASGPLSGVFLPGSGKITLASRSPATGGYGDSNMGGHLAAELKYAGYDAIVIRGAAARPSLIKIDDDKVEMVEASKYWGLGALEAERAIKDDLGEEFQVATIGPAGENRVHFACVSHDFGRQAGRTGIGAVLGSKKIKAIAVRGTRTIPLADPKGVEAKGREMYEACFSKPGFKEWTPYGTAGVTDWVNEVGAFPTRNFQTSYFEGHKEINGQKLRERLLVTDKGCFGCPIPCGKYSKTKAFVGSTRGGREVYVEGPEYETIALLGGNCGIGSIEDVAYLNYVCDELGIDTISGGNVAAFAIECFERGIIGPAEVGREIRFGDPGSVEYLLDKIARREGIGQILADGVRAAAKAFDKGSERFAIHVKGLEVSGYEPRWAPAMMLSYMTADVGGHHNRSWAITHDVAVGRDTLEGKVDKVIELQHTRPLFDLLGICRLQWVEIGFDLRYYEEIFPLVTGKEYSWKDLLLAAERVWNLTRAFNLKHLEGFGRSWDYPPVRWMEEPVPDGPAKGKYIPREKLDILLDEYYSKRGWDNDGRPTVATLRRLGLDREADSLAQSGKIRGL